MDVIHFSHGASKPIKRFNASSRFLPLTERFGNTRISTRTPESFRRGRPTVRPPIEIRHTRPSVRGND
jgi:hypothetical protein